MPRHVRKTRRSKKATAKQIEAKRKLSITVKNLFSSASTPRMFRASGVHTWKDHNKKDKGYQWDDDKNDPFKQIPKTKEIL